jgi:biotin transport system permease protein
MSGGSGLAALGVYRPGRTLLHRLPVGPKLLGLAVFSVWVVAVRDLALSAVGFAVALGLAAVGRVGLRALARSMRAVLVAALIVSALQWLVDGPAKAAEALLDLLALGLAALAVSATTPVNAVLDAVVRWLRPLHRLGVDGERVALAIGLAVQSVPGTVALALETRDAARARGLGRHPRAYLTPFVIRVVARAHETGDALHARGIGDSP